MPHPRPSRRRPSRRPPAGFTLVELIVVISIIAVVLGLIVVGISSTLGGTQDRATRTRLETLNTMLGEYRRNTAGSVGAGATATARQLPRSLDANQSFYDMSRGADYMPLAVQANELQSEWDAAAPDANHPFVITGDVMTRLLQVPQNRSSFDALPDSAKASVDEPGSGNTYRFMLDGSDQLILYVPSQGVANLTFSEGTFPAWMEAFDAGDNPTMVAADGGPFFMAAGIDGNFETADDNLYSVEVIAVYPDGTKIE